jgi:hypothetical protein
MEGLLTHNAVAHFFINPEPVADIFESHCPHGLRITPIEKPKRWDLKLAARKWLIITPF